MNRLGAHRIVFITGTDTGVGKTLLTGLLLHYLRRSGCHALAMKPFCSGGLADTEFLHAVLEGELTLNEISPYFFAEPIAPLVAARRHHRSIRLHEVLHRIKGLADRCQCLLIEGIGGVLVPLGEDFSVMTLIRALGCPAIVISRNRLGTLNHTLLTVSALQQAGVKRIKTMLMAAREADHSVKSNRRILTELLSPRPVFSIPYLGDEAMRFEAIQGTEKKVKKTLARILA